MSLTAGGCGQPAAIRTSRPSFDRAEVEVGDATLENLVRKKLVSREGWDARPPEGEMMAHEVRFLTIHHTGTPARPDLSLRWKLRYLQKFSRSRAHMPGGRDKHAWPDIPYHFYIDVSGQIGEGRNPGFAGDTNTDYSPVGHLSIAVEGDFAQETPSPEQLESLEQLVLWLADRWNLSENAVGTHRDYAPTVCPGKHLIGVVNRLRAQVAERTGNRRAPAGPDD